MIIVAATIFGLMAVGFAMVVAFFVKELFFDPDWLFAIMLPVALAITLLMSYLCIMTVTGRLS